MKSFKAEPGRASWLSGNLLPSRIPLSELENRPKRLRRLGQWMGRLLSQTSDSTVTRPSLPATRLIKRSVPDNPLALIKSLEGRANNPSFRILAETLKVMDPEITYPNDVRETSLTEITWETFDAL